MPNRVVALLALQATTAAIGLAAIATTSTAVREATVLPPVTSKVAVVAAVAKAVPVPRVKPPARAVRPPVPRPRAAVPVAKAPAPRPAAKPVPRPATVRAQAPRPPATLALTPRQRLDAAIARIPGYRSTDATWFLEAKDGYWGTADWYRNLIWISPAVPANRVYDVAVHEWSHLKSAQAYGGDVEAAIAAMNRYFGGGGLTGAERAADCMARVAGATWSHYTDCSNSSWRTGATRLLNGQRL